MTNEWRTQAERYRFFARHQPGLDWSEAAAEAMYRYETFGEGENPMTLFGGPVMNGYAYGKRWLNWHLTEWETAIGKGFLTKHELLTDPHLAPIRDWLIEQLRPMLAGAHILSSASHMSEPPPSPYA